MKYTVTAPASTRKALEVTFEPADVASAIDKIVRAQQREFAIPGFRKGKVPAAIVEKRLGEDLYVKATQAALDEFLASTLKEEKLYPLSSVDMDKSDGMFKRGNEYHCTLSFDVLPEFEMPDVEGLTVDQVKVNVTDDDVKAFINAMHDDMADLVPLKMLRTPLDGDQVNVTFEGFDENHTPIEGVKGTFDMLVGKGQVIPDCEAMVKSLLPGEEKEGNVAFPSDYHAKELAGKTIIMKMKVNDVKERKEIPMDDAFARKAGAENMVALHETTRNHLISQRAQDAKGNAMAKLLDMVMEKAPAFDIPAGLVEGRLRHVEAEFLASANAAKKPVDKKDLEEWKEAARPEVEKELRPQVLLMALARSKGIEVTDKEVEMQLTMMALRNGQDPRRLAELYQRNGMLNEFRDRLLGQKGLNFVYGAAKVTEIEPVQKAASIEQAPAQETPEDTTKQA